MHVQRLDVGADVVYIPSREILVIHPDLDYGHSLGAVMGTFPDMHADVARGLVEQVTPRPKRDRPHAKAIAGVVASLGALVGGVIATQPAAASAEFGEVWQAEMERRGLACTKGEGIWTCVDDEQGVTKVSGFRRDHASLYVIDRPGAGHQILLVFDGKVAAQRFSERHPDAEVTGRVASL